MNERIKELAVQAHLSWCMQNDFDQENLQKFAELIVQECAEFAGKQRNDIPACGFEFEAAIKEHFGVEDPRTYLKQGYEE